MTNQPSVAVVSGAFEHDVASIFSRRGFKITTNLGAANAIVFTGGADVTPSYYGEATNKTTYNTPERDEAEFWIAKKYEGKPMIGICRGAQLLNVVAGGKLYQHVSNHGRKHEIYDVRRKAVYMGTSMHHQMMRPGPNAMLLATAGQSDEFQTDKTTRPWQPDKTKPESWIDIETLYYPVKKFLCYQGHPECGDKDERDIFFGWIAHYLKLHGNPVIVPTKPIPDPAAMLEAAAAELKATQKELEANALKQDNKPIHGTD